MRAVYKYILPVAGRTFVTMHRGAQILSVQHQAGMLDAQLCIWALVETDAAAGEREIFIHGTGHQVLPVCHSGSYVATVQTPSGLVWHVFDGGWEHEKISMTATAQR